MLTNQLTQAQYDFLVRVADENPKLECDGMTTVLSYLLYMMEVPHERAGGMAGRGEQRIVHCWIRFKDDVNLCFRSQMWFGSDAPHGLFDTPYKDFKYWNSQPLPPITSGVIPSLLCDLPRYLNDLRTNAEILTAGPIGRNFAGISPTNNAKK